LEQSARVLGGVLSLPETGVVKFVAANRLPAIYVWRWFVDCVGLMLSRLSSYERWRRAANVDNILRGRKPADLVEQPARSNW
jgi:hypothetical protein